MATPHHLPFLKIITRAKNSPKIPAYQKQGFASFRFHNPITVRTRISPSKIPTHTVSFRASTPSWSISSVKWLL